MTREDRAVQAPLAVRAGALVALVSPATAAIGAWPRRIRQLRETLAGLDTRLRITGDGSRPGEPRAWRSAAEAADEVMAAFTDPDVDVVLCAMGGNSAVRVVEHLDYDLIARSRAVFQGSSDITALHLAINERARLATFYGPNGLFSLAEGPAAHPWTIGQVGGAWRSAGPHVLAAAPEWTDEQYALDAFDDGSPERTRRWRPSNGWSVLVEGTATGLLDGGCLESLCWHHPFRQVDRSDPRIVLLDIASPGSRALHHRYPGGPALVREWIGSLDARGYFAAAAAVVVSRPRQYTQAEVLQLDRVLLDLLGARGVPVVSRVDVGHTDPMGVWPLGCRAVLDTAAAEVRTLGPVVVARTS